MSAHLRFCPSQILAHGCTVACLQLTEKQDVAAGVVVLLYKKGWMLHSEILLYKFALSAVCKSVAVSKLQSLPT